MEWVLLVGLFTTGAGELLNTKADFKDYDECVVAAKMVADSHIGTQSRLSAFCVPEGEGFDLRNPFRDKKVR